MVGRDEKLSSFLGTPLYIAPEVIRGGYGLEAD
jgi:serine/threonine protein kinase